MMRRCVHEDAVRRMTRAHARGEDRRDPVLSAHVASCVECQLTCDLAIGLSALASRSTDTLEGAAPSASYLWWKAELLRRWDDQARAVEPVEIGERIGVGISLIGATALLVWLWRQMTSPAQTTTEGLWASLPWLMTATLVACSVLLGTAAVMAVVNFGSRSRKE